MIKTDQPTIFEDKIIAAVSSIEDGAMKIKGNDSRKVHENRRRFLNANNIRPSQTVLVQMSYETDNFTKYSTVKEANSANENEIDDYAPNDALATHKKGVALFLPIADCVGAILYDSKNEVMMVSHLGRHNIEQYGAEKSIEYMAKEFGSSAKDILIWMSPAAGKDNYPLYAFDHKSLHEVIKEHFLRVGILSRNIEVCDIDTTESDHYHSYSEFVKGNHEDEFGRFAIVAMMPA
ncbi:polyphenol oxidase family protein [Candidatus Saccharibacteria bacterium]|nr:polyphenol oxidase family protein [Candidatus Saccharibacteria bacterium]